MNNDDLPKDHSEEKPKRRWELTVVLFIWFGLLAGLLGGVVPRFAEVFDKVNVAKPYSTEAVLWMSRLFLKALWAWLPLMGLVAWRLGYLTDRPARFLWVIVIFSLPISLLFITSGLFKPLLTIHWGIG